jgi:hypothetical protein
MRPKNVSANAVWDSFSVCSIKRFQCASIKYTGRTLVDLQQKGWIDLIHPDDFEETLSHW